MCKIKNVKYHIMKKLIYLLVIGLPVFASCDSDKADSLDIDSTVQEAQKSGIYVNGEIVGTKSTDATITFTGGTVTGAGYYDNDAKAVLTASPASGYVIDYFYGGPETEPKKYNTTNTDKTSYNVEINNNDHYFKVGFKKAIKKIYISVVYPSGSVGYSSNPFQIVSSEPVTTDITVVFYWTETYYQNNGDEWYTLSQQATLTIKTGETESEIASYADNGYDVETDGMPEPNYSFSTTPVNGAIYYWK